jgi:hypothetical protein
MNHGNHHYSSICLIFDKKKCFCLTAYTVAWPIIIARRLTIQVSFFITLLWDILATDKKKKVRLICNLNYEVVCMLIASNRRRLLLPVILDNILLQ